MMEAVREIRHDTPHPAELIARARAMTPVLAGRSLEQRRRRQILPETIADMQKAGFFRVLQPRRWGGYEMDLHTFYEIQLALAEGDMSTAWIYGVLGVHPWFLAVLDDRAAHDVWGGGQFDLGLLLVDARRQGDGRRRRLSAERPLALRQRLRAWRLGLARRNGRVGDRRARRKAASSSCRARITAPSMVGTCPAYRGQAASMCWSTTCSCRPTAPRR